VFFSGVLGPPDIAVTWGRCSCGFGRHGGPSEVMLEDGCNTLVRARPKRQGPLARCGEALCPVAFAQAPEAPTGAKAWLGRWPRGQKRFHHLGDRWPAVGRPAHEALGGPFGIVPVGRGHVVRHGTVAALLG
jgi:hypothetical protein